jgi:hypothetical protein
MLAAQCGVDGTVLGLLAEICSKSRVLSMLLGFTIVVWL